MAVLDLYEHNETAYHAVIAMLRGRKKDKAWMSMYGEAEKYYREHGDLNVPGSYRTADGKKLSDWIVRQRRNHRLGKMNGEQHRLLERVGFIWEPESAWERGIKHARAYYREHGDLAVKKSYVAEDATCPHGEYSGIARMNTL